MRELPSGVVTFLMTDVEGSSARWATAPSDMRADLVALDHAIADAVNEFGGVVLKARGEGDSHFAVFDRPSAAVLAACALQSARLDVRVRAAVHLGEIDPADGDYYGVPVNQTARLRSLAHGGQTVVSHAATRLAEGGLDKRVCLRSLGHHRVRDFPQLQEVFQATAAGASAEFPPLRTDGNRPTSLLAVVVVDVCGASRGLRDGSQTADLQRTWVSVMRDAATSHGAVALKLIGDGCIAAFEDPAIATLFFDDLRDRFRGHGYEVRAAIDVGRIEVFDGEIVGESLFDVARLCRRAEPSTLVLTPTAQAVLGASGETRTPTSCETGT
jgi:class 3 adenylate cyclase